MKTLIMTARGIRAVVCLIGLLSASTLPAATRESSHASIAGSVNRVMGDHTVPVAGVKLSFSASGDSRGDYQAVTDDSGRYAIDLPSGTYRTRIDWFGDCPKIHRASFKLTLGEHLTFDFLLASCRIVDEENPEVSLTGPSINEIHTNTYGTGTKKMDVPLAKQKGGYQEELFRAVKHGRPEILVSFGRYDNRGDHTTYFSLQNQVVKNLSSGAAISPMPLPVSITVDKYTIRASTVLLNRRTMVFQARGKVSISDGRDTVAASSATLRFLGGNPKVIIQR